MTHLTKIKESLQAFADLPFADAAIALFEVLGYKSNKRLKLSPNNHAQFVATFAQGKPLNDKFALSDQWKSIDFLFQLTDDEVIAASKQSTRFESLGEYNGSVMESYIFLAIELKGEHYTRTALAGISRELNKLFAMPALVLFRYGDRLTLAIINRRLHKRDQSRDVLEKVTLIKDIAIADPHRGHLDILAAFSMHELMQRGTIANFVALHAAVAVVFNIELLNKRFYSKIQQWFFWAVQAITFPHGGIADPDQRNRIATIRLLTRVIFCWFAREKRLIPSSLFSETTARNVLKNFDPLSRTNGNYYLAILQNLFFPTLSVPLDQREFRNGRRYKGVNKHYMKHEFFRHEATFEEPDDIPRLFENIPFLNGGLFTCLDYLDKDGNEVRVDGFSDIAAKQPLVPNLLFFGKNVPIDISIATGNPTDIAVKIDGLYTILDSFKFTVTENTPIEEEVALDPELLGRIFENLLAEYNPETAKTARKQTGSFYTPRDIVDYMVTESLKAYLHTTLCHKLPTVTSSDASEGLDILFSYTEREHTFTAVEKRILVDAIYDAAILDPACGSGAFPMGMLQKLVYVLDKLDHDHDHWKQRILSDTPVALKEQTRKWLDSASADFTWKLGLIQHSIYGIDIQPFAVQIAKLRCFVSLLVDFDVDPAADNCGVPSLPNLDFKFVAANTLVRLPSDVEREDDLLKLEDPFLKEFAALAEEYFFVRDPAAKKRLQSIIEALIERQIATHTNTRVNVSKAYREENKRSLELWESYRNIFAFRNSHVGFFEPRYFFPEIKEGFDIVIGNPPYVRADEQSEWNREQRQVILASRQYETLWEKWDLFIPFLERGYKLLRDGGICALIVSDAYCHSKYAQKSQNWFLKNASVLRLDFCGDLKIFDAAVHNVIPFFQKTDGTDNTPERRLHKETFGNITLLPTDRQPNLTYRAFFPSETQTTAVSAFTAKTISLTDICYISIGMVVHANEKDHHKEFTTEELIQDYKDDKHPKPYCEGKHLGLWLPQEIKWLEWGTKRAPHHFRRKSFAELLENKKILVQRSPGPDPKCCFDSIGIHFTDSSVGFVPWHSLSGIRNNSLKKAARYSDEKPSRPDLPRRETLEENSRRFDIKFLLGVMNSSAVRDYLRANRRSNIHLYPDDWKRLPIPDVPAAKQAPIAALVDRILTTKRTNPTADVTVLEQELDGMVSTLYGQTEPELQTRKGKKYE